MVKLQLKKGYLVKVKVGNETREGKITDFHSKNGERTVSYGIWWCYRSQIQEVYKPNGERVY